MDFQIKNGEDLLTLLLMITLIGVAIGLLIVITNIFGLINRIDSERRGVPYKPFSFSSWYKKLDESVPVEQEEAIMMDHDYDGIRELDNHLPPWWVGLFYGGIIFAVLYLLNYHVWKLSPLQDEEYQNQMAEAEAEVKAYKATLAMNIDESNVEPVTDPSLLAQGKDIYVTKCVACHGAAGEGGVGPNLTDAYWIHGGSIKDIFTTIKYGVPQKGMIAWESQLKPDEMQDVASYILTLQGTNPPNAKEPQGEKYVPEEAAPATETTEKVAQL